MSEPYIKLHNLQKAYSRLIEGEAKYDVTNDLTRDGLIKRFECTFELAWKTLKVIFASG